MATYKNAYELAEKRKKKDDFVTALSELKTTGGTSQKSLADSFNSGYTLGGGQGNGLNNMASMLGQGLAGSSNEDSGGLNFGNALMKGLSSFGGSSAGAGSSPIASAVMGGSSGSPIASAINGTGGSGSAITDAINSGASSGGTKGFSLGGSGGGTPWALIGSLAKGGYNSVSGKDDEDYSDLEESVIYPLQGASMGAQFGPWGAAGGALYGLGYSFKDDLGLKDSNFLTQMLFPIGMGDGGGLKISGNSILDLG